jgi:LacI family transcriptional regulator
MMTASRAINNKPGVSETMRQDIQRLAEEMRYRPNLIAQGLVTRQTFTIGLIVPDITNPFFAQIARGVEDAAFERHYSVFLINTAEEPEREIAALVSLWQKDIDGVILCSSRLQDEQLVSRIQEFQAVVLINRELPQPLPNSLSIQINDRLGAQLAIRHFLETRRSKIGFVAGPRQSLSSQKRLDGFRSELADATVSDNPQRVAYCTPNTAGGFRAATELLTRDPELDAIFAFNDLVAVGVMQACQALGKRVPEDIAVIGADDIPLAEIIRPNLTSLHVDLTNIGALALNSLLNLGAGNKTPSSIQIDPRLYIRESG